MIHEGQRGLARALLRARRRRAPLAVLVPAGPAPGRVGRALLRRADLVLVEGEAVVPGVVPLPVRLDGPPGREARLEAARDRLAALGARPSPGRRARPGASVLVARLLGRQRATHAARTLARLPGARSPALAARLALAAGSADAAEDHAAKALARDATARAALRTRASLLERAGEPTAALATARAAADERTTRRLEGLLTTLTPRVNPAGSPAAASQAVPSPSPRAAEGRPSAASPRAVAPPRPRVLVLLESSLPHAPSGYAFRSAAVTAALRRAGLEPVVVTRLGFPASRGIARFAPVEWVGGVAHHRLWVPGLRHYTSLPPDEQLARATAELGALAERIRPALVWAASPHLNGLAGLALRERHGAPLVYDVRGFPELTWAAEHGGGAELADARAAAETAVMTSADRVVTLGRVMHDRITSRGVEPGRVHVLPHVVEPPGAAAAPPGARTRAAAAPPFGAFPQTVGLAATLRRYEGVDTLLTALARLRDGGADVRPLVLGDGPALAGLRQHAARLGFDPAAVLPGRVDQATAARRLGEMAIVAIPRHDLDVCRWVVPLKPLEAMAAGRPVVLSRLPALEEIGGEDRARFAPPGDADALAEALAADLADADGRAARADRAREWVGKAHGPAAFDEALGAALDGLVRVPR